MDRQAQNASQEVKDLAGAVLPKAAGMATKAATGSTSAGDAVELGLSSGSSQSYKESAVKALDCATSGLFTPLAEFFFGKKG